MDLEWQRLGACYLAYPPVDMLSMGMGKPASWLIRDYCDHCPVVAECASFALSNTGDLVGIWGGVFIPFENNGRWYKRRMAMAALREAAILSSEEHVA